MNIGSNSYPAGELNNFTGFKFIFDGVEYTKFRKAEADGNRSISAIDDSDAFYYPNFKKRNKK